MAITDLTADMLTMIRNASRAGAETVDIRYSKMLEAICEILKKEGFITNVKKVEADNKAWLKVYLKYKNGPAITGLKSMSTPGLRRYIGYSDMKPVLGGIGLNLVTTSQGILTDKEAKARKIGGEIICQVW